MAKKAESRPTDNLMALVLWKKSPEAHGEISMEAEPEDKPQQDLVQTPIEDPQQILFDRIPNLVSMPTEILITIARYLNEIDSTCLSVTNKQFYDIHRFNWKGERFGLLTTLSNDLGYHCPQCFAYYRYGIRCVLLCHLRGWFPKTMSYCELCKRITMNDETKVDSRGRRKYCAQCAGEKVSMVRDVRHLWPGDGI